MMTINMSNDVRLILSAVCCGDDPSVIDHDSTTLKVSVNQEHGLPRPVASRCPLAVDDVRTDVRDVR